MKIKNLKLLFVPLIAITLMNCKGEDHGTALPVPAPVPVPAAGACQPNYLWNGSQCVPVQQIGPSAFRLYGTLTNVNEMRVKHIYQGLNPYWYQWSWSTTNYSGEGVLDMQAYRSPQGTVYLVTLFLGHGSGGFPIVGQGFGSNISNNTGTQLVVYYGHLRFDIISTNGLMDGTIPTVSNVEILFNNDHLATTTLQIR